MADTITKLTDLLTGAECPTDSSQLEGHHAEGSKILMLSQQGKFAADEPETVDSSLGQRELVEVHVADDPAEEVRIDSGGEDTRKNSDNA